MKKKLSPIILSLCLAGTIALPVHAAVDSSRSAALKQQIAQLQSQLDDVKREMNSSDTSSGSGTKVTHHHAKKHTHKKITPSADTSADADNSDRPRINGPATLMENKSIGYIPLDLDVPGQSFVSSGPYLGVPLEYSGSNLIINTPSVNQDVALLSMRKNINQRLESLGMKHAEDHSHILLSGFVEAQAWVKQGGSASSSDIDLTSANFDAYILGPSNWTSGLIDFAYDNDLGSNEGSLFNNIRTQNSRVFVNKAFIIIGDFAKTPWYGSVGQMYVPFGTYSTTMVSSPFTKLIARTQARAVNVGFQQQTPNALYGAVYIYKGDSHGSATNRINNGGLNLGYRFNTGPFSEDFGAGVIGNIADSQVMQNTQLQPSGLFGGFGAVRNVCTGTNGASGVVCGDERLVHRVPAYDVHGKFSIGSSVDLLAEYITASTDFNPIDLMVNSHGARPNAFHGEIVYSFEKLAHPVSLSAAYDQSRDALPLGIPAKRYSMAVNTSFWRNTLEAIEIRHDIDYSGSVTSSGSQVIAPTGTGRSDNVITASIDLFF